MNKSSLEHVENTQDIIFPVEFTCNARNKEQLLIIDIMDWEKFSLDETNSHRYACDVVIGADIIYDPSVIPYLVNVLVKFLRELRTEKIILANCVRNEATDQLFIKYLEESNLFFRREIFSIEDGSQLNLYTIQNCQ